MLSNIRIPCQCEQGRFISAPFALPIRHPGFFPVPVLAERPQVICQVFFKDTSSDPDSLQGSLENGAGHEIIHRQGRPPNAGKVLCVL